MSASLYYQQNHLQFLFWQDHLDDLIRIGWNRLVSFASYSASLLLYCLTSICNPLLRDNPLAAIAKNPAEHHLCIFSVLQLRFILVHKKLSGNLSSTDALILLTAAGSLALLAGICTASPSCFQCSFSADHSPQRVQSNHANKQAATTIIAYAFLLLAPG
jgi:hypothetical protein